MERRVTFQGRNVPNTMARRTRSLSTVISQVDSTYPSYDVIKTAFYFCDPPFKKLKAQSDHENKVTLIPTEGHPTQYLTNTPHNCEGHQK